MSYWGLVIAEKVLISLAIGSASFSAIYIVLVIKTGILVIFSCTDIFYERLQKIRCLVIQTIHLLLIITLVFRSHIYQLTLEISNVFV